MNLHRFFSYFGSKHASALTYPAPKHTKIIEPFAGSAGYSLHYADLNIRLFDTNPRIVGVWDFLIHASRVDILALPDIRAGQATHDFDICQEARWLIGWWLTPSTGRPGIKPCSWMIAGARPNGYWGSSTRERLANQVDKIRHWKVKLASYESIPNERATWFVDPPYQYVKHRVYTCGKIDYAHLSAWVNERTGQTIVCEQQGADWLPFDLHDVRVTRHKHVPSRRTSNREAVWVSS